MTDMDDFRKALDGRMDWSVYIAAQVACGEKCYKCHEYINSLRGKGYRDLCYNCKKIDKPEELRHNHIIRCPYCCHETNTSDMDSGSIYEEGEHDIWCNECDKEFMVSTSVSWSFESPSLVPEEEDAED